ncbi:hypothetical protein AGMMS49944_09410 [Spirochaetia bacterium]|nr:hypothetical protein AGMMS49944_09410 [Spirochaetia bacterium]
MSNSNSREAQDVLLGAFLEGMDIPDYLSADMFEGFYQRAFVGIQRLKKNGFVQFPIPNDLLIKSCDFGVQDSEHINSMVGGYSFVKSNPDYYLNILLKAYRRRKLWTAVTTAKEAIEKGEDLEAVETEINKAIETEKARVSPDKGISFADLLKVQFPPDTWIVDRLIATGLTVITGASKIGKSWLCLQLTAALDQGGYFLGTLPVSKCDCLYCALEDTPKRIQKRLAKQGVTVFNGSRLETVRRNILDLRAFLKSNPQYRVIIIDTLQKFLGIKDMNDYSQTVDGLSSLKAMADDLNRAVIVIHHNRKGADLDGDHMESALGSTGINATADATLTMTRKRGTSEAILKATGRDIEDTSFTLSWDTDICSWSITGQGALKPTLTEAQQQIVDLLESEAKNWTTGEIIAATEKSKQAVSNLLTRLKEQGTIESPYHGQWKAKGKYTSTPPLKECVLVNSGNDQSGSIISFPAVDSDGMPEAGAYNSPEQRALWENPEEVLY